MKEIKEDKREREMQEGRKKRLRAVHWNKERCEGPEDRR